MGASAHLKRRDEKLSAPEHATEKVDLLPGSEADAGREERVCWGPRRAGNGPTWLRFPDPDSISCRGGDLGIGKRLGEEGSTLNDQMISIPNLSQPHGFPYLCPCRVKHRMPGAVLPLL